MASTPSDPPIPALFSAPLFSKAASPQGTWEDDAVAFQLFLGARPQIFGNFGFLTTPHCGVYSDDFTPFLPIVALSFPLVLSAEPGAATVGQLPETVSTLLAKCVEAGLLPNEEEPLERAVDLFAIVHSGFRPQRCCHLGCAREDEVNVLFHT